MIKRYLDLNEREKSLIRDFINRKERNKKSLNDIEILFNNKMYGFGEGTLVYFLNGKIIGKINIVLEVVKELGTSFIHCLDILDELDDKEKIIKALIDNAVKIAENHNSREILLSAKDKKTLDIFRKFGLHGQYRALKMCLEDRSQKESYLDLHPLNIKNKWEYLCIYNNSFSDMPHGSYIYINEVEEYLKKANEENFYFMVSENNTNIGFMNCVIKNGQGIFDIGLCRSYRGKGYGKKLLETAITFLNHKKVEKINLVVIEKNMVAYNMYKKRGFKEESVISYWTKIK